MENNKLTKSFTSENNNSSEIKGVKGFSDIENCKVKIHNNRKYMFRKKKKVI
jgi:hypothetical protein